MITKILFHTQEKRSRILKSPCICTREDAWLGDGYYFWRDITDAEHWGEKSKRKTGCYEIYQAEINCNNVLDTVFNEEHYIFLLRQVEKVALKIIKETGEKPTLKELNDYFKERGTWDEVDGIFFQDLPTNTNFLLVKPLQKGVKSISFAYRKRIQMVVYNLNIMLNFTLHKTDYCTN